MLIILFSKNPNFQIFKMHEALFRIPINIIGSNFTSDVYYWFCLFYLKAKLN